MAAEFTVCFKSFHQAEDGGLHMRVMIIVPRGGSNFEADAIVGHMYVGSDTFDLAPSAVNAVQIPKAVNPLAFSEPISKPLKSLAAIRHFVPVARLIFIFGRTF